MSKYLAVMRRTFIWMRRRWKMHLKQLDGRHLLIILMFGRIFKMAAEEIFQQTSCSRCFS